MNAPTFVTCPGMCGNKCNGEKVAALGFNSLSAKTVRVAPCSALTAQGWTSKVQAAYSKADAATRLTIR